MSISSVRRRKQLLDEIITFAFDVVCRFYKKPVPEKVPVIKVSFDGQSESRNSILEQNAPENTVKSELPSQIKYPTNY